MPSTSNTILYDNRGSYQFVRSSTEKERLQRLTESLQKLDISDTEELLYIYDAPHQRMPMPLVSSSQPPTAFPSSFSANSTFPAAHSPSVIQTVLPSFWQQHDRACRMQRFLSISFQRLGFHERFSRRNFIRCFIPNRS